MDTIHFVNLDFKKGVFGHLFNSQINYNGQY